MRASTIGALLPPQGAPPPPEHPARHPRPLHTRILRTQARLNFYIKSYIYGVLIEGGTWREKEAVRWGSGSRTMGGPPTWGPRTQMMCPRSVGRSLLYLCEGRDEDGGRRARIRAPNLCARSWHTITTPVVRRGEVGRYRAYASSGPRLW